MQHCIFVFSFSGDKIPGIGVIEVMVLTAGQVVLIFFIILGFFAVIGMIFVCELIYKGIKDIKQDHFDAASPIPGKPTKLQLPNDLIVYPEAETKWQSGMMAENGVYHK